MTKFSHLHVHTQFSLLDGAADISKLYKKAVEDKMPALAITDHGNMFGAFKFSRSTQSTIQRKIRTPLSRLWVANFIWLSLATSNSLHEMNGMSGIINYYWQRMQRAIVILSNFRSLGYIEGLYGKYPRVDKELLLQHYKGLIATTCCLGAIVPKTIIKKGEAAAEEEFKWWLDIFGEDYYIELQRHDIPEQKKVNEVLLGFIKRYNVKDDCFK